MTASSLIIVADRGRLKAYRVKESPNRAPRLRLLKRLSIRQARPKARRNVLDLTGRNPTTNESGGPHLQLISASPPREKEIELRICQELARQITSIVKTQKKQGWALAAPAPIHNTIVKFLPVAIRDWIVEHVQSDLVTIPAAKLAAHFRSLQPI